MSAKMSFFGNEEREEEEWELELVKSALLLSKRMGDSEFVPLPYDLYDDIDYTHTQISIPEELQQLASIFTQMMQMGQENDIKSHHSEEDVDADKEDEDKDEDEDEIGNVEAEEEEVDEGIILRKGDDVIMELTSALRPNAMHHAVFRCEVQQILTLLDEENKKNPQDFSADPAGTPFSHSLDTPDHCGNTPLLLAVKLGYIELAKLLIAEGFQCDITSKLHLICDPLSTESSASNARPLRIHDGPEFHLMDECVLLRSAPLIKVVYKQMQRNTYDLWLEKKKLVLQTLLAIPDFYVELGWEFTGAGLMGPVVKMFAPYDTYRIWKKGNWLRLDSTICEIHPNNLKVERAHSSLIFQGSNTEACSLTWEEGELYVLNHKEKTFERMLRKFSDPSDAELTHFAYQMIAAHRVQKGGLMKPKGSGSSHNNPQHMSVNSVDVDANSWTIKALTDRQGAPKTILLSGRPRGRDVYADLAGPCGASHSISISTACDDDTMVTAAATALPITVTSSVSSRLCYKWEASGHVKATVARKTSQDAHNFSQLSEEAYFSAVSALTSPAVSSSSDSGSKWSRDKKKEKKTAKAQEIKKKIQAAIYMVKDYPISLSELLPVLDVFAMKNEYLKKLVEIFNGNGSSHDIQPSQNEEKGQGRDACSDNEVNPSVDQQQKQQKQQSGASAPPPLPPPPTSFLNIPAELFPYRIQIPIILGISAMATFEHFQRNPDIDPALFAIDAAQYRELV